MGLDFLKAKSGTQFNKMLAYQLAKKVEKGDFLNQVTEAWVVKWESTTGSIEREKELKDMKDRIKRSGYKKAFDNAGITDEDLMVALDAAIRVTGRGSK